MFWIVALAAAAVVASIARHALQDHRDAELQRREALEEIGRSPRAPRALLGAPERELGREVGREATPGSVPPVAPPADAGTHTPPHGRARMM